MIAPDHHAQLNRSICYILVYTSTCAFPILLGYSLWLYYLALHYLLTRGCDHLIGRYRDTVYCHERKKKLKLNRKMKLEPRTRKYRLIKYEKEQFNSVFRTRLINRLKR